MTIRLTWYNADSKILGLRPWNTAYDPVVLRWKRHPDTGEIIDIDVRFEISGTYDASDMGVLIKTLTLANAIRLALLNQLFDNSGKICVTPTWGNDAALPSLGIVDTDVREQHKTTTDLLHELANDVRQQVSSIENSAPHMWSLIKNAMAIETRLATRKKKKKKKAKKKSTSTAREAGSSLSD